MLLLAIYINKISAEKEKAKNPKCLTSDVGNSVACFFSRILTCVCLQLSLYDMFLYKQAYRSPLY